MFHIDRGNTVIDIDCAERQGLDKADQDYLEQFSELIAN